MKAANRRVAALLLALLMVCACASALADTMAQVQSVTATSWIVNREDPTRYIPTKAADGDSGTSFQFSTLKTPLGEELIFFTFTDAADINQLWIRNGFWKSSESYYANCRVKKMNVSFKYSWSSSYTGDVEVTLPDEYDRSSWIKVDIGQQQDVTGVCLMVTEIYKGTKYPNDVCITEVQFRNSDGTALSNSVTRPTGASYGQLPTVSGLYGLATMKLATRNGPGTTYEETGTYFVEGQYIQILSRAYDKANGVWWVQCVIPYRNEKRTLWTGYHRFDSSTLPLEGIPIDQSY